MSKVVEIIETQIRDREKEIRECKHQEECLGCYAARVAINNMEAIKEKLLP